MKKTKNKKIEYLCVDSCIFVQCCLFEIDGDDLEVLTKLRDLLDKSKVKLLLPELIKLEFYKVIKRNKERLFDRINKYKKDISIDGELRGEKTKEELTKALDEYSNKKSKLSEKVEKEIELIFSHKNTVQTGLELNPNIFVEAYKMSFNYKKPFKKENRENRLDIFQQDCLIIESLRSFLKDKLNYNLYFCSLNKNDFVEDTAKTPLIISKDIGEKFNNIYYYENLGTLLNEKFETKVSQETIKKLNDKNLLNNPSDDIVINKDLACEIAPNLGTGEKITDLTLGEPE